MKRRYLALAVMLLLALSIIEACEPQKPAQQTRPTVKYTTVQNPVGSSASTKQASQANPAQPTQIYTEERVVVTRTTTPSQTKSTTSPTTSAQTKSTASSTTTASEEKPYEEEPETVQQSSESVPATQTQTSPKAGSYKTYAYLLQNADLATLLSHPRDLYVIDIDDSRLTPSDIATLRSKGSTVVSYLSIGEAEDYRNYWVEGWSVGNPDFLDEENPDWPGNYKVKFWDPQWQSLILANLDKIVDAGYDGVYLDIIDGYEYYKEKGVADADRRMIDWVKKISARAKSKNPSFLVIPQNSPELVDIPGYLSIIDGLGKESTWYENEDPLTDQWAQEAIAHLDRAVANGKFVLAIDYPKNTAKRCDFIAKSRSHGFVPTVGPLALDRIEEYPVC